jgi:carbamoyl-phosphate synthase large subunit
MKSVGEVMGIGRSFQEALHKATQSLEIKRNGLGADGKGYRNYEQIIEKLTHASWDRVFVIYDAIAMGIPLSSIHEITKIDMWFLKQYEELYALEREISNYKLILYLKNCY